MSTPPAPPLSSVIPPLPSPSPPTTLELTKEKNDLKNPGEYEDIGKKIKGKYVTFNKYMYNIIYTHTHTHTHMYKCSIIKYNLVIYLCYYY